MSTLKRIFSDCCNARKVIICATLASVVLVCMLMYLEKIDRRTFVVVDPTFVESTPLDSPDNTTLPTSRQGSKKFLYLMQGPSCIVKYLKQESKLGNESLCNCDILMLGYKSLCNDNSLGHIEYIFNKQTTWSTGRNFLYEHAMKRAQKYVYYIFMDGDIDLKPVEVEVPDTAVKNFGAWRAFEMFLLEYIPAVAVPGHCWPSVRKPCPPQYLPDVHQVVARPWPFDAAVNAVHVKALPYVLPYVAKHEATSWHLSQMFFVAMAVYYFEKNTLLYRSVEYVNPSHAAYPRIDITVKLVTAMLKEAQEEIKKKNMLKIHWEGKSVNFSHTVCPC